MPSEGCRRDSRRNRNRPRTPSKSALLFQPMLISSNPPLRRRTASPSQRPPPRISRILPGLQRVSRPWGKRVRRRRSHNTNRKVAPAARASARTEVRRIALLVSRRRRSISRCRGRTPPTTATSAANISRDRNSRRRATRKRKATWRARATIR